MTFFFFGEHLACTLCPWSLASSIPTLDLERVCPRKLGSWPRIFLSPWPRTMDLRSSAPIIFEQQQQNQLNSDLSAYLAIT